MIILLYGPDSLRRERRKKVLFEEFRKKHPTAPVAVFDGTAEDAVDKFTEFASAQSLFAPSRLIVASGFFDKKSKSFTALLKGIALDKNLLLIFSEAAKIPKEYSFVSNEARLKEEFDILKGPAWLAFARSEAKRLGMDIGPEALNFIARTYEGDSWGLVTELQKVSGWGKAISLEDLREFSSLPAPDFWSTLQGLKSPQIKNRLAALTRLLEGNEAPGKIFNILAYQGDLRRMSAYDLAVKSGKLDYEEVLLDLATR